MTPAATHTKAVARVNRRTAEQVSGARGRERKIVLVLHSQLVVAIWSGSFEYFFTNTWNA